MQLLAILASASLAVASATQSLSELKAQGCIFQATKSADLKSSNYRANCRKNLDDEGVDHWTLEELGGRLVWRDYEGDADAKQLILKTDCDHVLESQVLFNYIHGGNADMLCPLFDDEDRSLQVRALLNGVGNMRFIDKEINMAKGQIFTPAPGKLTNIHKRQLENHFAEALDEYLYNVQASFEATRDGLNRIFADFVTQHPEARTHFNGTFLARANAALATAHLRLEAIVDSPSF